MPPAPSLIVFSTAAGAGYGLMVLLGIMAPAHLLPGRRSFAGVALLLALGLATVGLASSMRYFGWPEPGWRTRAATRSAWFSRESRAATATYGPAAGLVVSWALAGSEGPFTLVAGTLTTLGAVITVTCTAMIFVSTKAVRQWHNGWVIPNTLATGLMMGAVLLNLLMHLWGGGLAAFDLVVALLIAVTVLTKEAYWDAVARAAPPPVRENHLSRGKGFRLGRRHAARLRSIARLFGFTVPLLATTLALLAPAAADPAAVLAALSLPVGIAVERWLFFAEATHTVQIPYRAHRV